MDTVPARIKGIVFTPNLIGIRDLLRPLEIPATLRILSRRVHIVPVVGCNTEHRYVPTLNLHLRLLCEREVIVHAHEIDKGCKRHLGVSICTPLICVVLPEVRHTQHFLHSRIRGVVDGKLQDILLKLHLFLLHIMHKKH